VRAVSRAKSADSYSITGKDSREMMSRHATGVVLRDWETNNGYTQPTVRGYPQILDPRLMFPRCAYSLIVHAVVSFRLDLSGLPFLSAASIIYFHDVDTSGYLLA